MRSLRSHVVVPADPIVRCVRVGLALLACALAPSAFAVKLINKDGTNHNITIKCSTTTQTSIGGNVHRDVGAGPCTVTVQRTGSSATGNGADTLVIQNGMVTRK